MSEKHVDYRDLNREERHEIIESLADMAIDVVIRHQDILLRSLFEFMAASHEYGYVAHLGLSHAIKQGRIIARNDGTNTLLSVEPKI